MGIKALSPRVPHWCLVELERQMVAAKTAHQSSSELHADCHLEAGGCRILTVSGRVGQEYGQAL